MVPDSYLELLADEKMVVAALAGSVELSFLIESQFPEDRLLQVLDAQAGTRLVSEGIAHVFLLSYPSVQWIAQSNPELNLFALPAQGGPQTGRGAFGFSLQDAELRDRWNGVLEVFWVVSNIKTW